jgi:hypothetical protein
VDGVDLHALADRLGDAARAPLARYGVRDDLGQPLDCLKIQQAGEGRYVGVSHIERRGRFDVHLATSADLVSWTWARRLDADASQPTIVPDGQGGWLLATEAMRPRRGNALRFWHFPSTEALLRGAPDARVQPRNTLVRRGHAQGTPHLFDVDLSGGLVRSRMWVGFHAFDGRRDRQAEGVLHGFARWTARARPDLDALFPGSAGNIGDRDAFTRDGWDLVIHEAQERPGDWGSWRVFLRDPATDAVAPIPMRTAGGSTSFGNPTVTALTLPDGRPGLVVTMFVFAPGAALGEQGPLVYIPALPTTPQ